MTIVLRPSAIESGNFLRPEQHPRFLETVRGAVRDKVDALFTVGNGYSLGGDVDMVCFFDGRTTEEVLETQRSVNEISEEFGLANCDLLKLIREPDGYVAGMESIHYVGPMMHVRSRVDGPMEVGMPDVITDVIQAELDARMNASPDPINEEIVAYASHKTVSLVQHAGREFDPESPECVAGLGRVLSYAGHAGRQMMRGEIRKEPGNKRDILEWADAKDAPHMQELSALLREEQTFRSLLRAYADDASQRSEYIRYLRFVRDQLSVRVIDFTREIRRLYSKKRS